MRLFRTPPSPLPRALTQTVVQSPRIATVSGNATHVRTMSFEKLLRWQSPPVTRRQQRLVNTTEALTHLLAVTAVPSIALTREAAQPLIGNPKYGINGTLSFCLCGSLTNEKNKTNNVEVRQKRFTMKWSPVTSGFASPTTAVGSALHLGSLIHPVS